MRSLLQFELAELGIYQGSEFRISRLLNFIYSTAFNENTIHVYADDREDILNALYNFKIYPQFFHIIVFFDQILRDINKHAFRRYCS